MQWVNAVSIQSKKMGGKPEFIMGCVNSAREKERGGILYWLDDLHVGSNAKRDERWKGSFSLADLIAGPLVKVS